MKTKELKDLLQLEEVRALAIRSDIKLGGATGARVIGCDDGNYYVCKSPRFLPYPQPYLLVNEQISKNLADLLGLPVQPSKMVNLRGELLFGSLIDPGLRDLKTVRLTREKVKNLADVFGILVFDIFTCNIDRHLGNSLALVSAGQEPRYLIRIMDHSHALMGTSLDRKATLQDQFSLSLYLSFYELNVLVESSEEFDPALASLEALSKEEVALAVSHLPADWLPNYSENCRMITSALIKRRDRVRALLEKQLRAEKGLAPIHRIFPNLRG